MKSFFYLLVASTLSLSACGLSQAEIATQTSVAQTLIAVSWTDTPTLTPTQTLTAIPTETATPTLNPDPCLPANLPDSLETLNEILTRFDSLSALGFYQTRQQLSEKMPELQNLRQAAQDQTTPPCLKTLRDHQLKYMDLVIKAFTAFIDGKDMIVMHNTIMDARKEAKDYSQEMMRLLNSTPAPEAQ